MMTALILAITLVGIIIFLFQFLSLGSVLSTEQFQERLRTFLQDKAISLYFFWYGIKLRFTTVLNQKKSRALQFRVWVNRELVNIPELQAWVMELPDPALQALTEGALRYCATLNIQLSWLFTPDLEAAPAVRETIKAILVDFLAGCLHAVKQKEDIALFSVYQQLISPDQYKRRIDLRRSVFKKVTELGLADPIPPHELIMSSELQRQALAASALRNAASKDWPSFAQALSNVLAANEQPAT